MARDGVLLVPRFSVAVAGRIPGSWNPMAKSWSAERTGRLPISCLECCGVASAARWPGPLAAGARIWRTMGWRCIARRAPYASSAT